MSNDILKYWKLNDYVHKYDLNFRKGHIYHTIIKENLDKFKDKLVLHVGCNSGSTTALIAEYCRGVVGIDVNNEALNFARNRYFSDKFLFFHMSLTNMEVFKDECFDTIVLFDIWEHILEEDKVKCLKEMLRVLKPEGSVLVFLPRAIKGMETVSPGEIGNYAFSKEHQSFYYTEQDLLDDFEDFFSKQKIYNETRENPEHCFGNENEKGKHNSWFAIFEKRNGGDEE